MSGIALLIGEAIATTVIKQWMAWQEKQSRPAGYVWTAADIAAFLADIASDTPEKILAEVQAEEAAGDNARGGASATATAEGSP